MIKEADKESIAEAVEIIKAGDCVAFPTETVYGLGANALDESAVAKIFEIKGRPANNPLIVHVASLEQIELAADLSSEDLRKKVNALARFWPGPLTLILPRNTDIPNIVTAGLDTVGVRIPAHPTAIKVISEAGLPIAAPSANRSSYISPTRAEHVADCLGQNLQLILDGGECEFGIESTVLDITGDTPTILRPGAVTKLQIAEVLPDVCLGDEVVEVGASPGMQAKHYSPRTPVMLLSDIEISRLPEKSALVSFRSQHSHDIQEAFEVIAPLTAHGDLSEAASRLYSTLRNLDKSGYEMIIIEDCPDGELDDALRNRIQRAATDD